MLGGVNRTDALVVPYQCGQIGSEEGRASCHHRAFWSDRVSGP